MSSLPTILIAGGVWPHIKGNREAANVISHQITYHLARSGRFDVSYVVINPCAVDMPESARAEVDELERLGVHFLKPVLTGPVPVARGMFGKILALARGKPDRLLVGTGMEEVLYQRLGGKWPDAVLSIWAEAAANMVSNVPGKRFNYSGNPDYKVLVARQELAERVAGAPLANSWQNRMRVGLVRAAHLAVMRRFDHVWNVAANDAAEYAKAGVRARYLQNMWPGAVKDDWSAIRDASERLNPIRIVGNVGNLSATGNSFGLITLATEIVPRLKEYMGSGTFEIHLFGGGEPHPSVAPILADPHFHLRGFVDDLDSEILSSPIFLVANNSQRFKVGHTRFLHAWSLGACVVGFADSAEAMPEISHGVNALLGRNAEEVAQLIVMAATNPELRKRIADGGIATLKNNYSPAHIVGEVISDMESMISCT